MIVPPATKLVKNPGNLNDLLGLASRTPVVVTVLDDLGLRKVTGFSSRLADGHNRSRDLDKSPGQWRKVVLMPCERNIESCGHAFNFD